MFHSFVSIDFIFDEIDEYRDTILQKTKLDKPQLIGYTEQILSKITILPRYVVSEASLEKASLLTKDVDFNDVWFVALAIEYNLPLLSRDSRLYNGLQKKSFKNIVLFSASLHHLPNPPSASFLISAWKFWKQH